MAVPQQKKSKAKRRSRRAQHDKVALPQVGICENCGADVVSHRACGECGWYGGRVAVVMAQEDEFLEMDEEQPAT
jgi:large subunit ribosomal protein L32